MGASKQAIISGIGISQIGRRTGVAGVDLTLQSAREALQDAGIGVGDLGAIASFGQTFGETPIAEVAQALGSDLPPDRHYAPQGLLSDIMTASELVLSGAVRHVLVYRTVKMLDGNVLSMVNSSGPNGGGSVFDRNPDLATLMAYHAYAATNWIGMHCQRHMHLYGTTKEQLGWLAVSSRAKAAFNPRAVFRTPLSLDDYMAGRKISSPFGIYDCDLPVDGSVAVIVSAPEHAADLDHGAVRINASSTTASDYGWTARPDFPQMANADAAKLLWSRTDLKPKDVDIAQLYDGFTFLTLSWLEALGLCGLGESGPFVEGGTRIALDGDLPLNTYGGQLSAGRMHGYWILHEACLQLRGQAGDRQLKRSPQVAVVAAGGGPIASTLLLTQ